MPVLFVFMPIRYACQHLVRNSITHSVDDFCLTTGKGRDIRGACARTTSVGLPTIVGHVRGVRATGTRSRHGRLAGTRRATGGPHPKREP